MFSFTEADPVVQCCSRHIYVKPVYVQNVWGELTGSQRIENELLVKNKSVTSYPYMLASPK